MTDKNPHKVFSRAWLAWNGRKGGKAGRGAVKRRDVQKLSALGNAARWHGNEPPPAIPGPVTTGD